MVFTLAFHAKESRKERKVEAKSQDFASLRPQLCVLCVKRVNQNFLHAF